MVGEKQLADNEVQFKKTLAQMEAQTTGLKESNGINREALESGQRAFIISHDVLDSRSIISDPDHEYAIWHFAMSVENTGNTPANVTTETIHPDLLPNEPTERQFAVRPWVFTTVIGAKDASRSVGSITTTEVKFFGNEMPHSSKDIVSMPIHTLHLGGPGRYLWGWVTYRDIFPNTPLHLTEFGRVLRSVGINKENPKNPFDFTWSPCAHHNCADKYCDDYKQIVALSSRK